MPVYTDRKGTSAGEIIVILGEIIEGGYEGYQIYRAAQNLANIAANPDDELPAAAGPTCQPDANWSNESADNNDEELPSPDTETADNPPTQAGPVPKPEDIEGKTPEEIDDMMNDQGWPGEPTASGGGTRYPNPDVPGEQVRTMPGNPDDTDPVKQGPYGRISSNGQVSDPIPLQGNPTLK